jgi:hypothetical protein
MLRKMSAKTIMAEVDVPNWSVFKDGEKKKFLFSIGGTATDVQRGESTYGTWTAFKGEFIAIVNPVLTNGKATEPLSSYKAFLPDPFAGSLAAALTHAERGVEFAINVFIRPPTDKENVKYVYEIEPVIKVQENAATSRMLAAMTEKMKEINKALPAPETVKETGKKK